MSGGSKARTKKRSKNPTTRIGKIVDFLSYLVVVLLILTASTLWLTREEALAAAVVIFIISSGMIVFVSFSSSQKKMITEAPYHKVNYKIFSPFALVLSFAVICYQLNGIQPQFFVGNANASMVDFSVFTIDNILRVILWDLPEVYGLSASRITHNVDNFLISTFILLFRTLIGLSLIRMLIVYWRH